MITSGGGKLGLACVVLDGGRGTFSTVNQVVRSTAFLVGPGIRTLIALQGFACNIRKNV